MSRGIVGDERRREVVAEEKALRTARHVRRQRNMMSKR
jgi:hypothetical protein